MFEKEYSRDGFFRHILATLHECCFESNPKKKKMEQKIFQVINDSVQMKSVKKESVCWLK